MTQQLGSCLVNSDALERQMILRSLYDGNQVPPYARRMLQKAPFNLCEACLLRYVASAAMEHHRCDSFTPEDWQLAIHRMTHDIRMQERRQGIGENLPP